MENGCLGVPKQPCLNGQLSKPPGKLIWNHMLKCHFENITQIGSNQWSFSWKRHMRKLQLDPFQVLMQTNKPGDKGPVLIKFQWEL